MKTVKILLLIFLFVSVSNAQTGFPIHIVLQVGDTLSIEWEYDWIGSDSLKEYIVNFNLWINQGEDTTFVGETEKDSVTFRPPLNGKIDIRYISGRYAVGMSAVDYWGRESLIHFSTDTTAAYGGWSVINDPFGPGKPHSSNLVK